MRTIPHVCALVVTFSLLTLGACQQDTAKGPAPEIQAEAKPVNLPAVPKFQEPQGNADGSHSVLELRRKSNKFMDQDVRVSGYVVWRYDCEAVWGKKVMKDNPEKCERPHFYLGQTADDPPQKSIMVVDVPRPLREDEKKFLPEEDVRNWPVVPEYKVGDQVTVAGKWATKSPLGFVRTDGLLVYAGLTHPGEEAPAAPTE